MLLAEFVIPSRVRIKKNGKRIFSRATRFGPGRITVLSSPQYCQWEAMALRTLKQAWRGQERIEDRLEAHFEFHFENKLAEPDTSNCVEGPQDCLQAAGVIRNDKQIQKLVAFKVFDSEPKTIIRLYKYEGDTSVAMG